MRERDMEATVLEYVDPTKSEFARVVYNYGKTHYQTGFLHGIVFSSACLLLLAIVKYIRQ